MAKRSNPALASMWGSAETSHLETQISERNAEIEDLKRQLTQLQQTSNQAVEVQRYSVDLFIPLQLPNGLTQPRKYFDPDGMEKLRQSIAKVGVQEPLLVRPSAAGKLEVISGERRWRTSLQLGMSDLPAISKKLSDEDALEIALVANLMREDLNIIEETDSIIALIGLRLRVERAQLPSLLLKIRNQRVRYQKSNQEIAEDLQQSVGYSGIITAESIAQMDKILGEFSLLLDSFVSNRLSAIQKMPEKLLDAVREGQIDFSKADLIRKVPENDQDALLTKVIEDGLTKAALTEKVKLLKSSVSNEGNKNDEMDIRDRIHKGYSRIRGKKIWSRILSNPKLKKKAQSIEALIDELNNLLDDK